MSHTPAPSLIKRLAAISYDSLLLIAVCMLYGLVYIGISKLLGAEEDSASGILFQLGWLASIYGFFCYFWMRGGQTTGMRAWRIKITTPDQTPPTFLQCLLRFTLAPIGWLLFFTLWLDPQQRGLHERWSGTQLMLLPKQTG